MDLDPKVFEDAAELVDKGWWRKRPDGDLDLYKGDSTTPTRGPAKPAYKCAVQAISKSLNAVDYNKKLEYYCAKALEHLGKPVPDFNSATSLAHWNDYTAQPGEVAQVFREIAEKIRADKGSIDD